MILNDFINHLDRSVFNQKAYCKIERPKLANFLVIKCLVIDLRYIRGVLYYSIVYYFKVYFISP